MRDRRAGSSSANRLLWVAGSVVSVLFIIAVSYAFYGEQGTMKQMNDVASQQPFTATKERVSIAEIDTDGDGLPDWEEGLWGTDPNNPDTDGDGIPDARGTVQASDWRSASENIFSDSATNTGPITNVTTIAARELFGSYMNEVLSNNTNLSPEEQALLVEETLTKSVAAFQPPRITLADLMVVPSSPVTGKAYTDTMVGIITRLVVEAEYDYVLMRDLVGDGRDAAMEGLEKSIAHYAVIVEELQTVSVPQDAALNHVDLVSGLMGYSFMVESIKDMGQDPVRATAALQFVLQYDQALTTSLTVLGKYMSTYKS